MADREELSFLHNQWYVLCESAELTTRPLGRVVNSTPMVTYRGPDGTAHVLFNLCPHRRAPLSMGWVEGDALRCGYHGMLFDPSGQCIEIPTQELIPPRVCVPAFPSVERYGFVWAWLGNPNLADPGTLPDLSWRERADWDHDVIQHFHVKAPHMLMVDNLLDLSHVAFLHHDSIGFDAGDLSEDPLQVTVEDDTIRCSRFFSGVAQAPAHREWFPMEGPVDRSQLKQWYPPSVVSVLARNEQRGGASAELRADHFISPESADSHHYYVALSRSFRVGDREFSTKLDADTRRVHGQDVEMAEAQHAMTRWTPGRRDMALKADRAVSAAHRILARLQQAEVAAVDG